MAARVRHSVTAGMAHLSLNIRDCVSSCIGESRFNIGPVSEPMRTGIKMSVSRRCSEKNLTSLMRPHKVVTTMYID